jgi:hypothetical protein
MTQREVKLFQEFLEDYEEYIPTDAKNHNGVREFCQKFVEYYYNTFPEKNSGAKKKLYSLLEMKYFKKEQYQQFLNFTNKQSYQSIPRMIVESLKVWVNQNSQNESSDVSSEPNNIEENEKRIVINKFEYQMDLFLGNFLSILFIPTDVSEYEYILVNKNPQAKKIEGHHLILDFSESSLENFKFEMDEKQNLILDLQNLKHVTLKHIEKLNKYDSIKFIVISDEKLSNLNSTKIIFKELEVYNEWKNQISQLSKTYDNILGENVGKCLMDNNADDLFDVGFKLFEKSHYDLAIRFFFRSANHEKPNICSMDYISKLYHHGLGVQIDLQKENSWKKKFYSSK